MVDEFQAVPGVDPEPVTSFATPDPELLVAIAQPLRMRLLIEVMRRAATAADLAATLEVPLTRLYYHLNLLEEHGAVKVVATRPVRGVEEKRYRAVAYSFGIDPTLLSPGNAAFARVVKALFDSARAELQVAGESGLDDEDRLLLVRLVLELSPDRRRDFFERLQHLIEEFAQDRAQGPDTERQSVLFAVYPMPEP